MEKLISCQLGDLIEFKNGKAIKPNDGVFPIYGGNGVLGYSSEFNAENSLIIGRVGAYCGSVFFEKNKFWVSDNAILGIPKNNINAQYAYYLLKQLDLNSKHVGSSQPLLTQGILSPLNVSICSDLPTQQKIAHTLSILDRKIALNQQINAKLEAMAKTLYDYWFVQFDFPNSEGKPYRSSGGEMVWCDELKREVPKGWTCNNILAISNLLGGGTPSKSNDEFWNGNIPFFTPTDCDNSVYVLSTKDNITELGLKKSSTKLFAENSILITARGSVGRLSLNAVPMAMNQSCYALQAKENISYSFLFFKAKWLVNALEVKATGSVFNSIVSSDIENTLLVIPNKDIIKNFGKLCEPIFEKIKTNAKQTQKLTQLRDFLLPMLMNGQVGVR